ncbi:MAG: prepilin-type N-terminal cleavage/methylation domain-containing protein [Patescibacteria group bacterium]|nr:prepilin-type N-terminal cleavage/methylation domain-containing protein [Patescibacteria group bacterium]
MRQKIRIHLWRTGSLRNAASIASAFRRAGFTLIEIMTVVAIIGLLSTIGTVSYESARRSSRDTKRVSDVKALREGVEMYFETNGAYPPDSDPGQGGTVLGEPGATVLSDGGFSDSAEGSVYLQRIPKNPFPGGTPYTYRSLTADGRDCSAPKCDSYAILFTLEKGAGDWLAGPHALTTQGLVGAEGGSAPPGVTGAGGLIYGLENLPEAFVGFAETTVAETTAFVQRDDVQAVTEKGVAPAIAAAAAVNAAAAAQATTAAGSFQYILFFLTQPILAIKRRRRKHWGTIYNSLSNLPEDLAIIRLRQASTNRILKSEVTDKDGRFSFIAPEGRYLLEVSKLRFQFPSQVTKGFHEQGQFVDLYHGEEIPVGGEGAVLTPNVPIDPVGEEQADDRTLVRQDRWRRFQRRFALVGPVLGGASIVIKPSVLTALLFLLQVALYFFFRRFAMPIRPKNWGVVYDDESDRPVLNAVVRIFALPYHKLLESRVTDTFGRYNFRVGTGKYYLTVTKKNYLKTETDPVDFSAATEPTFIAADIPLRRSATYKEEPESLKAGRPEPGLRAETTAPVAVAEGKPSASVVPAAGPLAAPTPAMSAIDQLAEGYKGKDAVQSSAPTEQSVEPVVPVAVKEEVVPVSEGEVPAAAPVEPPPPPAVEMPSPAAQQPPSPPPEPPRQGFVDRL